MTFNPTDQSLVIIGGYSEKRGFNDVVLVQAKHGQGPLRAWHRWDFSAETDFLKWEIPKLFCFSFSYISIRHQVKTFEIMHVDTKQVAGISENINLLASKKVMMSKRKTLWSL